MDNKNNGKEKGRMTTENPIKTLKKKYEEELAEAKKQTKTQTNQTKKINSLFLMHKGILKRKKKTTNPKQPVVILKRKHGMDEFHEGATGEKFHYKHSNGTNRWAVLDPRKVRIMPWGGDLVKYYDIHEDIPFPLPQEPIMTAETFHGGIDKVLNVSTDWETKQIREKGNFWWKILLGIAMIIGVLVLAKLMIGDLGIVEFLSNIIPGGGSETPPTTTPQVPTVIP